MKKTILNTKRERKDGYRRGHQRSNLVELKGGSSRPRRAFPGWVVGAGALIVVGSLFTLSLLVTSMAQAPPVSNAGSRPFANPSEIRYRDREKRLRGIMKIISGPYDIPSVGSETLRQYRGWDPKVQPEPTPNATPGPGPTLRARLGDQVQLSFLNKVNQKEDFPDTTDTEPKPGEPGFGCDRSPGAIDAKTGTYLPYPGNDVFPNCFHGSSTANIHFHGTHTSPDGLGDNVLVQVLPQFDQPDWTKTFDGIFDTRKIPQKWTDMPPDYQKMQLDMIKQYDIDAAADAEKRKRAKPEPLLPKDLEMIASGQWPQYLMGAFPNFFDIPDYDLCKTLKPTPCKAGQAPGTHWYHAHKHGSTSLHILNGLAGAFIIESSREGGYDHFIRKTFGWDTYDTHEKILVFQQLDPTQNLERTGPPATNQGKGIKQVLVNGKLKPTITMSPGEVQLWRLVNATEGNLAGVISAGTFTPAGTTTGLFQTTGKGFSFMQTAMDGVQFSPTNYISQPFLNTAPSNDRLRPGGLVLAAGNRADLLVQAPMTAGLVEFKNLSNGATLFFVDVVATRLPASKPSLPTTMPPNPVPSWAELPEFLKKDLPAPPAKDVPNVLQFQWEADRVGAGRKPTFPPHFMINGKQFAATGETVDQCMPLNGLQDWILENHTVGANHPFHIHINPFQVIQIDIPVANADPTKYPTYTTYAPKDNFIWQDVIAIPKGVIGPDGKTISPGRVRIRHTFVDFTGTYVLHCHILAHEDRGMMQLVRVVPADKYPNKCQDAVPAHH